MADISRIVSVNISRQTTVPATASFSDVIIVSSFGKADPIPDFGDTERVRSYASLSEVAAAGFGESGFVYRAAAALFGQNPRLSRVFVGRKLQGDDGSETWTQAMTAIALENSTFYAVVADTRVLAEQQAIAAWAETNGKLFVCSSADANMVDAASGDIADVLNVAGYTRSAVFYHQLASDGEDPVIEAAILGKMLVKTPGSATWAFKQLSGVVPSSLLEGQMDKLVAKKANYYVNIAGTNVTQGGTVASGEFVDVIHGIDYLIAKIQQRVMTIMINNDKVPYTEAGIQALAAAVTAALNDGVTWGLLAPGTIVVTPPVLADIDPAKKAARILPSVEFTAVLAGAVHKTEIHGTVTL